MKKKLGKLSLIPWFGLFSGLVRMNLLLLLGLFIVGTSQLTYSQTSGARLTGTVKDQIGRAHV